jgi:O-antigen ligase
MTGGSATIDSKLNTDKNLAVNYFLGGIYLLIIGTLFPTFRALLIGPEGAKDPGEFLISALPDIALLVYSLGTIFIRKHLGQALWPKPQKIDLLLLCVVSYAIIIGSILSADLKFIVYGLRMSYIPILMYVSVRNLSEFLDEAIFLKGISLFMHWIAFTAIIGLLLYFPFSETEDRLKSLVHASRSEYMIPRLNSIYHAPTLNGAYMSIAAAYFSIRFIHKYNFRSGILLGLVLICLLLSVSRGGIIAYIIALAGIIIVLRKWKTSLMLLGVIVSSILIGLASVNLSFDKAGWIFKSSAATVKMEKKNTRVELWDSSFDILKKHPMGLGLGKSGWVANRFSEETEEETAFAATDGWYLKTANEIGLPGFILFISFFIHLAYLTIKKTSFLNPGVPFYMLVLLIQILLLNIVSNSLDYFIFNSFFWMCAGMVVSYVRPAIKSA